MEHDPEIGQVYTDLIGVCLIFSKKVFIWG